ncbi:MAG: ABC transporter permease, partial [Cellulosilyticaceae bacterium]
MARYIVKRFVSTIITLFLIGTLTFVLMNSIPGGPFTSERQLPPEIEAALMEKYGLDQPLWKQYITYFSNLAQGDMGISIKHKGVKVNDIIAQSFPVSAKVGVVAVFVILILGIP